MILDSSFLIALGHEDPDAFRKGTELVERGEVQWLPTPVIQELEYGVEMVGTAEERRRTRNVVRLYPHIDVDAEYARRAGQLLAAADKTAGGPGNAGVDSVDAFVGAVADVLGEPVLTDNVTDFEALGVDVETW